MHDLVNSTLNFTNIPILYLGPVNVVKDAQNESEKLKKNTNENSIVIPAKTKMSKIPQKNHGDSNNNSSLKDKSKGTYILK